jgi:putative transposase
VPQTRRRRAALAAEGMAVPRRNGNIVGTYFVTSRTWESRQLFLSEPMCRLFFETLFLHRKRGAYFLHACVLMPDHFHVLLTPSATYSLERVVQLIKGGSSHAMGIEHRLRFPVWQRGFSDHRIRDEADLNNHLHYIDQNPVRKKLVASPSEYRWSSATGLYTMDPIPQGLKPQEKVALLGAAKAAP